MKPNRFFQIAVAVCLLAVNAGAADPQLTIYNQNFAVVRVLIPLELKPGENRVQFTDTTAYLEPASVILRDPTGARTLQILEQNYRADPVSQQLLLSLYEGKTLDFLLQPNDPKSVVRGKVIRSGYISPRVGYSGAMQEPIIEVDGQLRFGLPGSPVFPALIGDTILKPTLNWVLQSDKPGEMNAEFSYVTGQITWNADYNLVAPEKGDQLDLVGWVTVNNQTGKTFDNARIKLMAGNVNKIQPPDERTFHDGRRDHSWSGNGGHSSPGFREVVRGIPSLRTAPPHYAPRSGEQAGGVRARIGNQVGAVLCLRWGEDQPEPIPGMEYGKHSAEQRIRNRIES